MRAKRGRAALSRAWRMIAESVQPKNTPRPTVKTRTLTRISIESHEMLVIRPLRRRCIAWCDACGVEVRIVTPEQAANFSQTTARAVYRQIERGSLHAVETGDGSTFICGNAWTNS